LNITFVTPCSLVLFNDVSEDPAASFFRVLTGDESNTFLLKHQCTSTRLYDVTSLKTVFFWKETQFTKTDSLTLLNPFYYQLMHIMLKNTELLKHSKIIVVYLYTVHDTHALQVTICSHSTDGALHIFYADPLNQMCNF